MKNYCMAMALCGCLLIGSLYPKLLLDHHVKLVNQAGIEQNIDRKENFEKEIPLKIEFRIFQIFR
ncbi:MAG: hypothetical protein IKT88_00195 [Lachnospiraceae bacterium]|nr:hypothetical protein [Lachnospiraceae bacterium]